MAEARGDQEALGRFFAELGRPADADAATVGRRASGEVRFYSEDGRALADTKAEVLTFRAPRAYKDRIKQRADADATSESQVIRDALDAYL